jgi:hypothetical protein
VILSGHGATPSPTQERLMSNDSDNRILMKTITKVTHVYGTEPAGIMLQMTTNEGEIIDVFLPKEIVKGTRDILQTALEKYLLR